MFCSLAKGCLPCPQRPFLLYGTATVLTYWIENRTRKILKICSFFEWSDEVRAKREPSRVSSLFQCKLKSWIIFNLKNWRNDLTKKLTLVFRRSDLIILRHKKLNIYFFFQIFMIIQWKIIKKFRKIKFKNILSKFLMFFFVLIFVEKIGIWDGLRNQTITNFGSKQKKLSNQDGQKWNDWKTEIR